MTRRTLAEGRAVLADRAERRRALAIRDHEIDACERAAFYRVCRPPTPGTTPTERGEEGPMSDTEGCEHCARLLTPIAESESR